MEMGYREVLGNDEVAELPQTYTSDRKEKELDLLACRLAKIGSWHFDADTLRGQWNDKTYRIHGIDKWESPPTIKEYLTFCRGDSRGRLEKALRLALDQGQTHDLVLELALPNGEIKWIRSIGRPVIQGGRVVRVEGSVQDVSEFRSAVRQMEQGGVLDSIARALPDMLFLLDDGGTILDYRAQKSEELFVPPEFFLGLRVRDVLPDVPASLVEGGLRKLRDGAAYECFEYSLDSPEGIRQYECRMSRMPEEGRYLAVARDITGQRRYRSELERLQRIYDVSSLVNQALVKTRSKDEYFRRVCRAVVERGEFRLAWIGECETSTHQVVPKSWAGEADTYIRALTVYYDTRPEGLGPVGTAIRERVSVICSDFFNSEKTRPWQDRAREAGIKSMAAFPFFLNGQCCGALAVYGSEAGIFQEKEVELLNRVASDISFGLEHYHREELRRQAELELDQERIRLRERMKELRCLYAVFNQTEDETLPLEQLFERVMELIVAGWQYPELTEVRIEYEGKAYCTSGFAELPWMQVAECCADTGERVRITVAYRDAMPEEEEGPFLNEERNLIDTITRRLSDKLGQRRTVAALKDK